MFLEVLNLLSFLPLELPCTAYLGASPSGISSSFNFSLHSDMLDDRHTVFSCTIAFTGTFSFSLSISPDFSNAGGTNVFSVMVLTENLEDGDDPESTDN